MCAHVPFTPYEIASEISGRWVCDLQLGLPHPETSHYSIHCPETEVVPRYRGSPVPHCSQQLPATNDSSLQLPLARMCFSYPGHAAHNNFRLSPSARQARAKSSALAVDAWDVRYCWVSSMCLDTLATEIFLSSSFWGWKASETYLPFWVITYGIQGRYHL